MKKALLLFSIFLISSGITAQKTDKFLKKILYKNKNLQPILENASKYRVQILYTPIIEGKPAKTYAFRHAPKEYFYPASTIKLPAVILSLEKLNSLKVKGLTMKTPLRVNSTWEEYPSVTSDESSENGLPSLRHYAKKVLIVSDNDAFNRLYDFLGPAYFNEKMASKKYNNFAANHRLSIYLSRSLNSSKPAIAFGNIQTIPKVPQFASTERMEVSFAESIYSEKERINESEIPNKKQVLIAKGYYKNGELVKKPMDFATKNKFALLAQHQTLKALFFPNSVSPAQHFKMSKEQDAFLKKHMSMLPRESDFPKYNAEVYYDGYAKFFMYGDTKQRIPDHIKIYNKIGQAYGFLIDNAYIQDTKHNISFMLSAVIYVNEDGILNDDKYEYDTVGIPFLAELGRTLHAYEIKKRGKL